jgi:hypothetical protein
MLDLAPQETELGVALNAGVHWELCTLVRHELGLERVSKEY